MSRPQKYVFILWGDRFDEVEAVIFVTELRKAGLRVKLVGLTGRRSSGMSGMTLVPDLTLQTALPLTENVYCLIIPCKSSVMKHLNTDPRLQELFQQVQSNNATVIVGEDPVNMNLFLSSNNVTIYPDTEDMVSFARQMARELAP